MENYPESALCAWPFPRILDTGADTAPIRRTIAESPLCGDAHVRPVTEGDGMALGSDPGGGVSFRSALYPIGAESRSAIIRRPEYGCMSDADL